jgi:tetratricopeptide (TPR) repeat protein
MRNYLTWFVLLITCTVVIGPIVSEMMGKRSYARWVLAQAANDYQNGSVDAAATNLARASEISPEIAIDENYWKLRFQIVFDKEHPEPNMIEALFDDASRLLKGIDDVQRSKTAKFVAWRLKRHKRIDLAIELLEQCFPPIESRPAEDNNEIAYYRSLTKAQLELALQEIDTALKQKSEPELFDTKAWILHGLGRDEQAIKWADASIERTYEMLKKLPGNESRGMELVALFQPDSDVSVVPQEVDANSDRSKQSVVDPESNSDLDEILERLDQTRRSIEIKLADPIETIQKKFPTFDPVNIAMLAKNIAVMRFHRACILDELNRIEDSEVDYAWLDRFGFSKTNELE